MSQNSTVLTRIGQRILNYLMEGDKRPREVEGTQKSAQFESKSCMLSFLQKEYMYAYISDQSVQSEETTEPNDAPPTKKQKKMPKILDGVYYLVESNENGRVNVKCQTCNASIKGSLSSTGNFKSHYKKHPKEKKELDEYLKQGHNIDIGENTEGKRQTQPRIEDMLAKMAPVSDQKVIFWAKIFSSYCSLTKFVRNSN